MNWFITFIAVVYIACSSAYAKSTEYSEDNFTYQTHKINNHIVHTIELDPKKFIIKPILAANLGKNTNIATVADIAKHFNAIAAINGGFFLTNTNAKGMPAGILKIDNKFHGIAYKTRAAIGWSAPKNHATIDRLQTKTTIQLNNKTYLVNTFNRQPSPYQLMLFSTDYAKQINLPSKVNIIFRDNTVTNINADKYNNLPDNSFIYAIGKHNQQSIPKIKVGDLAKINIQLLPKNIWQKTNHQYIIGGAPLLIKNGKLISNFNIEKLKQNFIKDKHSRTAIGILANNNWLLVLAEKGFTIPELAKLMLELGCKHALNLDGGSSSTMFVNGKVVNNTEVENESYGFISARKVSDAILILPTK